MRGNISARMSATYQYSRTCRSAAAAFKVKSSAATSHSAGGINQ